jgi:S-DNA-T family DNA segregation ATPase FtsK/SpoIIIE
MLRLQVFDEVRVRKEADIDRFPFFIGREVGNELVLTDPSISKKHARIENRGEAGLVLIDLNSTNGLWKENEKVDELILTPGLQFRLGKVLMGIEEVSDHSEKTVSIDRTYLSRLDHIRPEEEPRTWGERVRLNLSFIFLFILICF